MQAATEESGGARRRCGWVVKCSQAAAAIADISGRRGVGEVSSRKHSLGRMAKLAKQAGRKQAQIGSGCRAGEWQLIWKAKFVGAPQVE